jgi:hypothetical protein
MTHEPYRYTCPRGHVCWQPRQPTHPESQAQSAYYCKSCYKNGQNPHFADLVDQKRA